MVAAERLHRGEEERLAAGQQPAHVPRLAGAHARSTVTAADLPKSRFSRLRARFQSITNTMRAPMSSSAAASAPSSAQSKRAAPTT